MTAHDWQSEPTRNLPELLRIDLRERWRRGERVPVEDYLDKYVALRGDAAALADLIDVEVGLRREDGECPAAEEYQRRFPSLAALLARRFKDTDRPPDNEMLATIVGAMPRPTDPAPADPPTRFVEGAPSAAPTKAAPTRPASEHAQGPPQHPGLPSVPGYRVLGVLGRGGMGVVYRAWQVAARRLVALKMIRSGAHAAPQELARFRTEAEAAARLRHPNIVQIYEVGEHDGLPFFSLEYVDGGSLAERLDGTPLAPARAAALVEALATAIHHAHTQGVVHRDLKPGNVLLAVASCQLPVASKGIGESPSLETSNWQLATVPKVTDFGLAKLLEGGRDQTHSEAVLGTPSYMAPEQAAGRTKDAGPPADVYALGAMLYELLVGRPPFKATTLADTLQQVIGEDPVPPRRLLGRLPRDLDTICLKCLQKEPEKRYASALALAEDLRRFQEHRPVQARPIGMGERAHKWARRHPTGAALVSVCAVALAALFAGGWAFAVARGRAAEREAGLRQEAEANFRQAMQAVDEMLTGVGAVDLADVPQMGPVRERLLTKAQRFFDDFLRRRGDDPGVRFEAARAYGRRGDILALQGKDTPAEEAYDRALALLNEAPPGEEARRELARNHHGLGALLRKLNRFGEARAAYQRALDLRRELRDEAPERVDFRQELAATYNLLGALLATQPDGRPQAEEAYRQAQALQDQLALDDPREPEYRRDLARTLNNLGKLLRGGGERGLRAAEESYGQAIKHQRELIRLAPLVPRYRQDLARSLNNLGEVLERLKQPLVARPAYEEARRLLGDLVKEFPTFPEYQIDLATTHQNLGSLWTRADVYDEAEPPLQAAAALYRRLHEEHPKRPEYRLALGQLDCDLGLLLASTGRQQNAEAAYRRALALHEGLAKEFPQLPEYRGQLGVTLENLAWLLYRRGGFEEPCQGLDALLAAGGSHSLGALGVALRARAALEEAKRLLERAVEEQQAAVTLAGAAAAGYRASLGNHHALLCDTLLRLGDHDAAAAAAENLANAEAKKGDRHFQAAYVLARCAALARSDERMAPGVRAARKESYEARAVEMLDQAVKRPGLGAAVRQEMLQWLNGTRYNALQPRPDFQRLLKEADNRLRNAIT